MNPPLYSTKKHEFISKIFVLNGPVENLEDQIMTNK